ncbi:unnamed protein product, partial [Owenia fusiformis]
MASHGESGAQGGGSQSSKDAEIMELQRQNQMMREKQARMLSNIPPEQRMQMERRQMMQRQQMMQQNVAMGQTPQADVIRQKKQLELKEQALAIKQKQIQVAAMELEVKKKRQEMETNVKQLTSKSNQGSVPDDETGADDNNEKSSDNVDQSVKPDNQADSELQDALDTMGLPMGFGRGFGHQTEKEKLSKTSESEKNKTPKKRKPGFSDEIEIEERMENRGEMRGNWGGMMGNHGGMMQNLGYRGGMMGNRGGMMGYHGGFMRGHRGMMSNQGRFPNFPNDIQTGLQRDMILSRQEFQNKLDSVTYGQTSMNEPNTYEFQDRLPLKDKEDKHNDDDNDEEPDPEQDALDSMGLPMGFGRGFGNRTVEKARGNYGKKKERKQQRESSILGAFPGQCWIGDQRAPPQGFQQYGQGRGYDYYQDDYGYQQYYNMQQQMMPFYPEVPYDQRYNQTRNITNWPFERLEGKEVDEKEAEYSWATGYAGNLNFDIDKAKRERCEKLKAAKEQALKEIGQEDENNETTEDSKKTETVGLSIEERAAMGLKPRRTLPGLGANKDKEGDEPMNIDVPDPKSDEYNVPFYSGYFVGGGSLVSKDRAKLHDDETDYANEPMEVTEEGTKSNFIGPEQPNIRQAPGDQDAYMDENVSANMVMPINDDDIVAPRAPMRPDWKKDYYDDHEDPKYRNKNLQHVPKKIYKLDTELVEKFEKLRQLLKDGEPKPQPGEEPLGKIPRLHSCTSTSGLEVTLILDSAGRVNNIQRFTCKLFIGDVFIVNADGPSKRMAKSIAYARTEEMLMNEKTNTKALLITHARLQPEDTENAISTFNSASKSNSIETNAAVLGKRPKRPWHELVILENKDLKCGSGGHSLLQQSADFSKMLLEWKYTRFYVENENEEGAEEFRVTCQVAIEKHILGEATANEKKIAKQLAGEKALAYCEQVCTKVIVNDPRQVEKMSRSQLIMGGLEKDEPKKDANMLNKGPGAMIMMKWGWDGVSALGRGGGLVEPIQPIDLTSVYGFEFAFGKRRVITDSFREKVELIAKNYIHSDNPDDLVFCDEFGKEERQIIHRILTNVGLKASTKTFKVGHGQFRCFLRARRKFTSIELVNMLRRHGGKSNMYTLMEAPMIVSERGRIQERNTNIGGFTTVKSTAKSSAPPPSKENTANPALKAIWQSDAVTGLGGNAREKLSAKGIQGTAASARAATGQHQNKWGNQQGGKKYYNHRQVHEVQGFQVVKPDAATGKVPDNRPKIQKTQFTRQPGQPVVSNKWVKSGSSTAETYKSLPQKQSSSNLGATPSSKPIGGFTIPKVSSTTTSSQSSYSGVKTGYETSSSKQSQNNYASAKGNTSGYKSQGNASNYGSSAITMDLVLVTTDLVLATTELALVTMVLKEVMEIKLGTQPLLIQVPNLYMGLKEVMGLKGVMAMGQIVDIQFQWPPHLLPLPQRPLPSLVTLPPPRTLMEQIILSME